MIRPWMFKWPQVWATGGDSTIYAGGKRIHSFTTPAKVITAAGTAQTSNAQGKFGNSLLLDGNGDALSSPNNTDFLFGSGDFTIELWVRFIALPSVGNVVFLFMTGGGTDRSYRCGIDNTGGVYKFYFNYSTDGSPGTDNIFGNSLSPSTGTWYHLAWVRYGNTLTAYLDGVAKGTVDMTGITLYAATDGVLIGRSYAQAANLWLNGYLDELRISKGIARWTEDFTPPTAEYVWDDYTKLLLHFDETNGSTKMSAVSGALTVTSGGNVEYLVVAGGGGGGKSSGGGGGAGGYRTGTISIAVGNKTVTVGAGGAGSTSDENKGSNGEASVFDSITSPGGGGGGSYGNINGADGGCGGGGSKYTTTNGTGGTGSYGYNGETASGIADTGFGGGGAGEAGGTDGLYEGGDGASSSISGSAVIYAGGGGGRGATAAPSGGTGGGGAGAGDSGTPVNGTANTGGGGGGARATQNGGSGGSGIVIAAYPSIPFIDTATKALLHFDGSNGSQTFTDETGKTWTAAGTAQISTSQATFGQSGLFDGNSDYISTPDSDDWSFGTGDFTIDFWVKRTRTDVAEAFIGQGAASGGGLTQSFVISVEANASGTGLIGNGSNTKSAGPLVLDDTDWHHVALIRSGNNLYISKDGVLSSSTDVSGYSIQNSSDTVCVGSYGSYTGAYLFSGYIDELRISKGIARWTADFTPPTGPYPKGTA